MRIIRSTQCAVDQTKHDICEADVQLLALHPIGRLRNVLLELRPRILDMIFVNFDGLFSSIFAHPGASGPEKSILDGLTDLRARNESSGEGLGPIF